MTRYDVGIGDFLVLSQPDSEIKTYALGSCVALVVWDSKKSLGGLVHIALPESKINEEKARSKPCYFVDSGLPLFFSQLKKAGADRKFSTIKLIGGASILDDSRTFDIGRRNVLAVKKFLWQIGLGINAEDIGGVISRTVSLNIETGKLLISNSGKEWEL